MAGKFKGLFREDMFDEEQKLPHAYHRSKFESEKLVREKLDGRFRIYRPGIVVGHSETGEMDKIDGPYYFFKLLQKLRHALPEWFPLVGPEGKAGQPRAGRLRGARDGPHRPPAGRRRPVRRHLPPGGPRADVGRARR